MKTRIIASASVFTTSKIEISTKREVSYGTAQSTPSGKNLASSVMRVLMAFATSSALAPGATRMAIAAIG